LLSQITKVSKEVTGKLFCKSHFWEAKRLKIIDNIFGRIEKVVIFALPKEKGVRKSS